MQIIAFESIFKNGITSYFEPSLNKALKEIGTNYIL